MRKGEFCNGILGEREERAHVGPKNYGEILCEVSNSLTDK